MTTEEVIELCLAIQAEAKSAIRTGKTSQSAGRRIAKALAEIGCTKTQATQIMERVLC